MEMGFASSKVKQRWLEECCDGDPTQCPLASIIDQTWGLLAAASCPHNSAILCQEQTRCQRCGWNPVVAAERQRRWTAMHR